MRTIELTDDQAELISKMIDLLDRTYDCLTLSEALSRDNIDQEWELRMLHAAQELAEEFPSNEWPKNQGRWRLDKK